MTVCIRKLKSRHNSGLWCYFHWQCLADCKWPICMKETNIFDLSLFWMKSLRSEVMEITLIVIDAIPWLPNNYRWYAAHIIAFTCCSLYQLVNGGAVMPGLSGSALTSCTLGSLRARWMERLQGAVTALTRRAPIAALSRWLGRASSLFPLFWSGNVKQKLGFLHPNASLSAGHPCGYCGDSSFWQRVASSRLLKGLPWPGAT